MGNPMGSDFENFSFINRMGSGLVLMMENGLNLDYEHLLAIKPDSAGTQRITKVFKA